MANNEESRPDSALATNTPAPLLRLAVRLQWLLSDELMALLALITLALAAVPFAFAMSPALERALVVADVLIVLLFALEYSASLLLAADKAAFVRSPWRLLDVFIILAALISLLPFTAETLGASPALRLIRFVRVAVLGTRSSARLAGPVTAQAASAARSSGELQAWALDFDAGGKGLQSVDWQHLLERIGSEQEDWLYVSGVGEDLLAPLAASFAVPEPVLHGKLYGAAFPRLDRLERYVTLFAWYPQLSGDISAESTVIQRAGLLLVGADKNVAVLEREPSDLRRRVERRLQESEASGDATGPALVNATHALVKEVVRAYARVAEWLETRLMAIEANEASLRDREFLQRTFLLRAEISRVRTTLRHLAEVTRSLNSRRIAIRGFEVGNLPQFQLLASEASDLYERVDDLSENLAALVDMRLNVSSFQMNKVMRLLAILTTLALIPSVAGGMLGMNLIDTPWPASLPQVAFWVGSGMALSLYWFAIKGWLR
ncbi:MAG: hypothetical protein GYB33_01175 [Gammaproteobacteria bacterium]|nr:hypothetical protein [Gammaproteobacteria bacterium]